MQQALEPFFGVQLGQQAPVTTGTPNARVGQVDLPAALQTSHDVFAEWRWDGQEVVVRNCRLGFFPLFFYATDRTFGVATSIEKLLELGAPTDLDDAAMAVFLRLGWVLGEDTVFKHIRQLPPNGELRWRGGQARVTGGYAFPRPRAMTRAAAVAEHGELIRQAVRRRASDEVAFGFPLSGGHDSRHLLLELDLIGRKPDICFTNHDFPPYRLQNIDVAKLLCNRLGLHHQQLGQPSSRHQIELRKNRLNNFSAMENTWCVSLYPAIAPVTRVVYEGSPGNNYFGEYGTPEITHLIESGRYEDIAKQQLDRWLNWHSSEDALNRVLKPDAARRFSYDLAVTRVTEELEKFSHTANPFGSFYFWNRGRHVAQQQPLSIARRSGVVAVTPYLDHDFVEFLSSVPMEVSMNKRFYTDSLNLMHPGFADVPFAGDQKIPAVESNLHYRRFLLESAASLATTGKDLLVQRLPTSRRLLGLAFAGGNVRMRMKWAAPFSALYLTQIESLIAR